ncbi:MAG: Tfp pilus assembly protein PilE [Sulfurimonas sp.]|jgi:Tfp pilus assembly protein PilE
MLEMAIVLVAIGILMIIAYEFSHSMQKREWGENSKSIF